MKQLDIHIHFWEGSQVSSHFYTSEFLAHADAERLHEKLIDCCATIGKQGVFQISKDGPKVNWKNYDLLSTSIEEEIHKTILNIGSCGLRNSSQCLLLWLCGNQLGSWTNLKLTLLVI